MEQNSVNGTGGDSLWIQLLGEVRAWHAGREVALGAPKQRGLFALLAMRHGHLVTVSEIIDALWGETPPGSAEGSIHTYVHGLRKAWEAVGVTGLLVRAGGGYQLEVTADQVDVAVVEACAADARQLAAQGRKQEAARRLQRCLGHWHGTPLNGVPGPMAEAERNRLTVLRLNLIEERAGLLLDEGGHREVLDELTDAVQADPLRESLRGQLMLALYRSGRQADALAVFEEGRRVLAEELGIDPGPELKALHTAILRSDPSLAVTTAKPKPPPRTTVVPAQLPHAVTGFVGRRDELAMLERWREPSSPGVQTLVVSAIDGAGGIGKTALALQFAQMVREDYPDGQLYVNLRGFDPSRQPLTAAEALTQLLQGFGVTTQPGTVDAQAALYRSLVADKRALIMLDNAASADQVRPLLPGSSNSLVLITSRNQLGGLVARDGARRLTLGLLTQAEALDLLRQLIGAERVDAAPHAAEELAKLCGYLPLALRIIGVQASGRTEQSLDDVAKELRAVQHRLDALAIEDDEMASVRAVFSWSYQALKPELAAAFRMFGLHPGQDFAIEAAATLADVTVDEAERIVRSLCEAHLLERTGKGRYRFHDLLRLYSTELAEKHDPVEVRRRALRRLMVWYLHTAQAAASHTGVGLGDEHLPDAPERVPPLSFESTGSAAAWHALEIPNVFALTEKAVELAYDDLAWRLVVTTYPYYYSTGLLSEWIRLLTIGVGAARRDGAKVGQARLLNHLGVASSRIGNNDEAVQCLQQAIALLNETDADLYRASLLGNLASVLREMGKPGEGLQYALEAAEIARRHGNDYYIIASLDIVCEIYVELGQPDKALEYGTAGLALADRKGSDLIVANLRACVAHAYRDLGQFEQARAEYERALAKCESIGDRYHQGRALLGVAELNRRSGQESKAREAAQQALEIFTSLDAEEAVVAKDFLAGLPQQQQ